MEPKSPRLGPVRPRDLSDATVDVALGGDDILEARRILDVDADDLVLDGVTFTDCELAAWRVERLGMAGTRLMDVVIRAWGAPVVTAGRLAARNLVVEESRLGALDIHDATIRRALVRGSKLTWVNLRAAQLTDVRFEDCTFDELDLSEASATRVAFHRCSTATLTLHNTRLSDVDLRGLQMQAINGLDSLRGATINQSQLTELAPLLAAHLGISVVG